MTHWTELLDPAAPSGAFLPWKLVEPRVGISRTTAWRLQRSGDFPRPYVVSRGRVGYRESEVEAWKASRGHRGMAEPSPTPRPAVPPRAEAPIPDRPPVEPAAPPCVVEASRAATPVWTPAQEAAPRRRRAPQGQTQMTFDF